MSDITTVWAADLSRGDWSMVGPSLADGNDLSTAVVISLFSDRLALADDTIPDGTVNRRGWWGDNGNQVPIGSRLWLLARAKQTEETRLRAYDYIVEALQWLIDDGVVDRFDITVEWIRRGTLGARVMAYKADGSNAAMNFSWVWGD